MKGLNLYNKETDDFIPISTNGSVFWLMQNSQNEICYLINNTLCIMNPVTYVTERFQFGDKHKIYFLYEDNDRRLWVGMWDSGLKWFDRENRKLVDANLTMENGKNFNNYFGRIYQARYLSGIVAGMNTKTNKIGYVAAMGSENSEVTGGIDALRQIRRFLNAQRR